VVHRSLTGLESARAARRPVSTWSAILRWAANWIAAGYDGQPLAELAGLHGDDPHGACNLLPAANQQSSRALAAAAFSVDLAGNEMRVLIATAGARGDVAPLTGLATAIRAAGHSVAITSNDECESLVVGCGLEFRPLPGAHGIFDDPRLEVSGGPAWAVSMFRLLAENLRTLDKALLAVARQDGPDVLALAGIFAACGYHIAEGLGLPGMELQLQPAYPTAGFPPSSVAGRSFGRLGNLAAGKAMMAGVALVAARPAREIRHELGLPKRTVRDMLSGRPHTLRWPVFHGFSPAVVPRPADWPDRYQVTGYWWPARPTDWSPPAELEDFLGSGLPPVFFGFGSLPPKVTSDLIELSTAAGRQAGVRQVIQAGQTGPTPAGLASRGDSIAVGDVPHDWLFPRMAAVVHRAGAGTTAAVLRAGVPAVTVPVTVDEPFWAARLAALGTGPPPIPHKQLSVAALAAAIREAVTHPSYRTRAEAMSRRLASEDGAAPVISMLARLGAG
jgi:sterol 3beta-glucosyltransferase